MRNPWRDFDWNVRNCGWRGHVTWAPTEGELADRLRSLGEAGRLVEFLDVDVAFHSLLLRASGNSMFGALEDFVAEVLAGRTHHGLMPAHPVPAALDAHEGVAHAVRDGDPLAAERWMRELVTEVRAALVDPADDAAS